MVYAKQVIVNDRKRYFFQIGYNIKIENQFYKIFDLEEMFWDEEIDSVTANTSSIQEFNDNLTPREGYMYFIELMGIDGLLGFQVYYKNYAHNSPRRKEVYLYAADAGRFNKKYIPNAIMSPDYPTLRFNNPTSSDHAGRMYFEGLKFQLKRLENIDPKDITYIELSDYMAGSMLG